MATKIKHKKNIVSWKKKKIDVVISSRFPSKPIITVTVAENVIYESRVKKVGGLTAKQLK